MLLLLIYIHNFNHNTIAPHIFVEDPFAPPSLDGDEAEDDDSPFSRNAGLFSTGGGLFDDNEDEVTFCLFINLFCLT